LFCPEFILFMGQIIIVTVSKQIEKNILKRKKGQVLFVSDFSKFGNYDTIRKALQRLVKKEKLLRIATGIYYYPKTNKLLGILYPSIDTIARAIAKRDKTRIIPGGNYALYSLGLSEQIPMNVVFLTDGSARKIKINNQQIIFKKTSPKNLIIKNKLTNLIIQSLKTIGKNNITENQIAKLQEQIKKSNELNEINNEIQYAPEWIRKIILQITKNINNELA